MINIPPEYNEFVLAKDTIYQENFYPDNNGLLSVQGNKAFYIPTYK